MGVHARSRGVCQRLGHERGLHAAVASQLLDGRLERRDGVGRNECRLEWQVEFELAAGDFVMARFNVNADRLQSGHDLQLDAAGAAAAAFEVAARVVGQRPDCVGGEEEELDFGRDQVAQSGGFGLVEQCPQRAPAIAGIRFAARRNDLADEPGASHSRRLHDGESRRIRPQVHVRLDFASQALDGRTVEPLPVGQHGRDTASRHGHGLHGTGDVGKLQLHLLNPGLLDAGQNPFRRSTVCIAIGHSGTRGGGSRGRRRAAGAAALRWSCCVRHLVPPGRFWGARVAASGHG